MTKNYQYRARSAASIQQRAEHPRTLNFDPVVKQGVQFFKPVKGRNRIRIFPPTWDLDKNGESTADHYGYECYMHYGIGANSDRYLCLTMINQECPICKEIQAMGGVGKNAPDHVKLISKKLSQCVWLIDRNAEDKGPMLWFMPVKVDRDLVQCSYDPDTGEVCFIDHPDEGFDVAFSRDGEGKRTTYTGVQIARKPTPLHEDESTTRKWLTSVAENPVPACLVWHPAEKIKAVFSGQLLADEDEAIEDGGGDGNGSGRVMAPVSGVRRGGRPQEMAETDTATGGEETAEGVGDDVLFEDRTPPRVVVQGGGRKKSVAVDVFADNDEYAERRDLDDFDRMEKKRAVSAREHNQPTAEKSGAVSVKARLAAVRARAKQGAG